MAQRFVGYFGEYLRIRLDETATAARKVNEAISFTATYFDRRVQDIAKGMTEEDRTEFYNQSADEDMFLSIVDQFTRRALLVSAYAQFEDSLKRLCRFLIKLGTSTVQVPRKGFHIGHAKDFLSAIAVGQNQFNTAAFGVPWKEIDDGWRENRNNLVHDGGVVELDQGVTVPADDIVVSQSQGEIEEAANAAKIKIFIRNRSDIKLEFGELCFEEGATDSFLSAAIRAIADIIQEIQRIAPPSAPEPLERPR